MPRKKKETFWDSEILRIYKCSHCEAELAFLEKVKDPWQTNCPVCSGSSCLLIEQATINMSVFIDLCKPKTLGTLAEQNRKNLIKEHGEVPAERENPIKKRKKKINYKILKDPVKYIMKGEV